MKKAIVGGILALLLLGVLVGFLIYQAKPGKAGPVPWGPEQDGVRIRLIPLAEEFRVGEPMPFRLEMKNVSEEVVQYDSQAVGLHDSFSVKDSAGIETSYVGGPVQTSGGARPLEAGQTVALVEPIDLVNEYLVEEPGKYRIQFRGQGPAFGKVRFPASNEVDVKVGKGKLSPAQSVAARLIPIVPDERWEVSGSENGVYLMFNPTGLKADIYAISLLLEKKELKGDWAADFELVGSRDGRLVYLEEIPAEEVIDEVWKDHRKAILEAAGVDG